MTDDVYIFANLVIDDNVICMDIQLQWIHNGPKGTKADNI